MKLEIEANLASDLLDMLYRLLPYLEDLEDDKAYKAENIAGRIRQLKALIKRTEEAGIK